MAFSHEDVAQSATATDVGTSTVLNGQPMGVVGAGFPMNLADGCLNLSGTGNYVAYTVPLPAAGYVSKVVIVTDVLEGAGISVSINTDSSDVGTPCSGATGNLMFAVFTCGTPVLGGNTVRISGLTNTRFCGLGIFPYSCDSAAVPGSETWVGTALPVSYSISSTMTAYPLPSLKLLPQGCFTITSYVTDHPAVTVNKGACSTPTLCNPDYIEIYSTDSSLAGTTVPVTIHAIYTNYLSQSANSVALTASV